MNKYKLILADDHPFLLEGLSTILNEDDAIEIIATATNGYELMDLLAKEKPDLVILDLNMPGYDGIECLKKIKHNYTAIKVLILSNYHQPELIDEVKNLLAEGYLIKNASAAQLKNAVNTILVGQSFFPISNAVKETQEDSYFFDTFLKKYQLTKREIEIIKLVGKEMSSKEIANTLFLSELTINTHRRNIFRKLEIKNVAGLMNFAKENLLI